MGSAFKNKGVQLLLDGVTKYLPAPTDVVNRALDLSRNEASFRLPCSPSGPFVGLAFKLEEGRYGQLTYLRVYSGRIKKGDYIVNMSNGKKVGHRQGCEMTRVLPSVPRPGQVVTYLGIGSSTRLTALPQSARSASRAWYACTATRWRTSRSRRPATSWPYSASTAPGDINCERTPRDATRNLASPYDLDLILTSPQWRHVHRRRSPLRHDVHPSA